LVTVGVVVWQLESPRLAVLITAIVAFGLLAAVSVVRVPRWLVARDTAAAELTPEQHATAVSSARSTLVQGIVGLAALAGIFVAWQQLQTDRDQARTDREQLTEQLTLTRQGQVAERFTRAVDQLGSNKLEQRLGGIYALERIAEESASTRLQVFEVLTAYVRQRAPRDVKALGSTVEVDLIARAPDVQAVMTVLGRRTVMATDPRLDLRATDLRKADLLGAQLQRAQLSGAQLQGADLRSAQLQNADFTGAQLEHADFSAAQLQGAQLFGAHLQSASLSAAHLQDAYLSGAHLQGADLTNAQLQGAQLPGAVDDASTGWPEGFDSKAAGVRRQ
jgi:hypothetical protein